MGTAADDVDIYWELEGILDDESFFSSRNVDSGERTEHWRQLQRGQRAFGRTAGEVETDCRLLVLDFSSRVKVHLQHEIQVFSKRPRPPSPQNPPPPPP